MKWFFVWLLVGAGHQVSRPYPTQQSCEAARFLMDLDHKSEYGKWVEKTYPCQQARVGGA